MKPDAREHHTGRIGRVQLYYVIHAANLSAFAAGTSLSTGWRMWQLIGFGIGGLLAAVVGHVPVRMVPMRWRLVRARTHTLVWIVVFIAAVSLIGRVIEESTVAGALLGAGLVLVLEPRYHLSARRFGVATVRS